VGQMAWALSYSTKFIYDGWNLLTEANATNNAAPASLKGKRQYREEGTEKNRKP